jgi:flagellar hook assembly protein FlgD
LPEKPPKEYKLFQNYPNPFNPESWIPFQLAKASEVNIKIYNVTGQLIKTIELGSKQAGVYIEKSNAARWDGRNDMGKEVASGVYFYELRAEKFRAIRKMVLLK